MNRVRNEHEDNRSENYATSYQFRGSLKWTILLNRDGMSLDDYLVVGAMVFWTSIAVYSTLKQALKDKQIERRSHQWSQWAFTPLFVLSGGFTEVNPFPLMIPLLKREGARNDSIRRGCTKVRWWTRAESMPIWSWLNIFSVLHYWLDEPVVNWCLYHHLPDHVDELLLSDVYSEDHLYSRERSIDPPPVRRSSHCPVFWNNFASVLFLYTRIKGSLEDNNGWIIWANIKSWHPNIHYVYI